MEDHHTLGDLTKPHREAARRFLDTVAHSVLVGDFDTYAAVIQVPLMITTRKARLIRATRDELKLSFDMWQRTVASYAVTEIVQTMETVVPFGDEAVMVTYSTELLSGPKLVMPSFTNWIFLRREGTIWKMEQMVSGVSNTQTSHFITVDPANANPEI